MQRNLQIPLYLPIVFQSHKMVAEIVILLLCAYLIGSASTAILLCKAFYRQDIRLSGSGNPGANNVQRMYGWKMGITVLLIDALKGLLAVNMVYITSIDPNSELFATLQLLLGLFVMLGHIFPIFFKFKGGKGVAILFGIMGAMHPWAMMICVGIFLIILLITRYISLSVLIAVLFYPIMINSLFALWITPNETLTVKVFSIVTCVIIWLSHISNIKRIINHTEEKFRIKKPVSRSVANRR